MRCLLTADPCSYASTATTWLGVAQEGHCIVNTITMTLDTYAHVMQTTLRAAAERMDDALGLEDVNEETG